MNTDQRASQLATELGFLEFQIRLLRRQVDDAEERRDAIFVELDVINQIAGEERALAQAKTPPVMPDLSELAAAADAAEGPPMPGGKVLHPTQEQKDALVAKAKERLEKPVR